MVAAVICTLVVLFSIIFFAWVPVVPVDWVFTLPVVVGVGITVICGEVFIRNQGKS